ncbi:hypothetical protein NL676_001422 [Syzygium grande]|nr:hypothetical protein NL676_001422 [Syzygium grande]
MPFVPSWTTLACLQSRNTGRSLTQKGSGLVVSRKKGSATAPRLVKGRLEKKGVRDSSSAREGSRDATARAHSGDVELDVAATMFSHINAVSVRWYRDERRNSHKAPQQQSVADQQRQRQEAAMTELLCCGSG